MAGGSGRRGLLVSRGWVQAVVLTLLFGFLLLGLMGYSTYSGQPPIPERVVGPTGNVVFTGKDIRAGQKVFLKNGLMEYGSVFGHAYRYRWDQFGWTSESSELLEKKMLMWGSVLFHLGILAAFAGHVMGIIIPIQFYHAIGFRDPWYEILSLYAGTLAGGAALIGILIINIRRWFVKRLRTRTETIKFVVDTLLLVVIAFGLAVTLGYRVWVGDLGLPGAAFFGHPGFDYRHTIGPWFRSLFSFAPDPNLMASVAPIFKIHILFAFLLFGLWPYSHLVHVWSVPIGYLRRSHIQYRSRDPRAAMSREKSRKAARRER